MATSGNLNLAIDNAHRFTHVEHEGLAVVTNGPGLDHELHRLLHRHEAFTLRAPRTSEPTALTLNTNRITKGSTCER